MTAARYRSYAAVLARARLEELLAAVNAGDVVADGADAIGDDRPDASGGASPVYLRRWRVTPAPGHPDRLAMVAVQVEPQVPRSLHAGPVEVMALVVQP